MNFKKRINEIVRKEILNILNEKIASDNLNSLDGLVNQIINDANDENLEKKDYHFEENGINTKITAYFNKENYCGWAYDDWVDEIIIYIEPKPNFYEVKSILTHELIHKIDNKREKDINREKYVNASPYKITKYKHTNGFYFLPNTYDEAAVKSDDPITEDVNEVLYRLWSKTERNAYVSHAYLTMNDCKELIKFLEDKINLIEQSDIEDNADCWAELNKVLYYNREIKSLRPATYIIGLHNKARTYESDEARNRCKKYFLKKSRYLLKDFSKKLLKNCMNNTYLKRNKPQI